MSEQGDWGADEAALVDSLRGDLPSARDRERVRQRLAAAGVLAVGTASSATAAAASSSGLAGVPAGLMHKIAAWTWSGKIALASAVCAGASAPLVMRMLTTAAPAQVAKLERASLPASTPAPALAELQEATRAVEPAREIPLAAPRSPALLARPSAAVDARPSRATPAPAPRPRAQRVDAAAPFVLREEPVLPAGVPDPQPIAASPPADAPLDYRPAPRRSEANVYAVEPPRGTRTAPSRPRSSSLAEETKLLERALAALQVHDLAAARSWLTLHAARFQDGLLRRERENVWRRVTAIGDAKSQ